VPLSTSRTASKIRRRSRNKRDELAGSDRRCTVPRVFSGYSSPASTRVNYIYVPGSYITRVTPWCTCARVSRYRIPQRATFRGSILQRVDLKERERERGREREVRKNCRQRNDINRGSVYEESTRSRDVDAACESNPELPNIPLIPFTVAFAINIQVIFRLLILMDNSEARGARRRAAFECALRGKHVKWIICNFRLSRIWYIVFHSDCCWN